MRVWWSKSERDNLVNKQILDAIYRGATMAEICSDFAMTPDFVMRDWLAWRGARSW
jgi:hypothetical protein